MNTAINADKAKIQELTTQIAQKREALPKPVAKTVEELTADFVKNNGTREAAIEKATEKATNSLKDDFANTFSKMGKISNPKLWTAIGGVAAVGALLGLAFRPSAKEA